LYEYEVSIEDLFKLERRVTFKLAALISDVNILHKIIVDENVDISPFVAKLSRAFLPSVVYQLEEYGLPRMISRKVHHKGIINFEESGLTIHDAIADFNRIGEERLLSLVGLQRFERYIIHYSYAGIKQKENTAK
jgi:hypothetical protein